MQDVWISVKSIENHVNRRYGSYAICGGLLFLAWIEVILFIDLERSNRGIWIRHACEKSIFGQHIGYIGIIFTPCSAEAHKTLPLWSVRTYSNSYYKILGG